MKQIISLIVFLAYTTCYAQRGLTVIGERSDTDTKGFMYVGKDKQIHRMHSLGMTFSTSPPIYSCAFCHDEFSPRRFLPHPYDTMQVPMRMGIGISNTDTTSIFIGYSNGYYMFVDSLEKAGIKDYHYFMERWNETDTSCISNEIARNNHEIFYEHWSKTHVKGKYFLNKNESMDTNGMMYYYDDKGEFNMMMGGRFTDSILQADKWYRIIPDKPDKKKKKK